MSGTQHVRIYLVIQFFLISTHKLMEEKFLLPFENYEKLESRTGCPI